MRDPNSAFCGICGKQFASSGESSPTPLLAELQQRPITPGLSNSGFYAPVQPGYTPPPPQRSRSNRIYLIVIVLLALMLVGTFVFFLGKGSGQVPTGNTPGNPNQVVTKLANSTATSTTTTASPTESTTTSTESTITPTVPIATPAVPILTPAETLPENITLKCDCSDRVVITITKIVVEPSQNRMLWSLTFYNNSQSGADSSFNQFTLQKGDQINDPTPGEQTYDATGGGIDTDVFLNAGETKQVTLTFSFVPYKNIPYTLVSKLSVGFDIVTFNPEVIQF